jgi:oligopeptide transport system substrate-binding protein
MLSDIGQIKNAAEIIAGKKDKSELGVTAVDDKTLKVELNSPVSYFTSLMYFPTFYPVNEEFFNSCADTFGTSPETTLSNGAFILDSYEPAATEFHLSKNENYYDASKIQLAGLDYQVIQDSQTALMSYQNGELDMTLVNGDQVDQVKDDPAFKAIGAGYLWYVSPNIKEVPELANDNIRKALTFAIDREAITSNILKDGSKPTYTAVPMDFAAGPDGSDFSADQTKFQDVCASDTAKAAEYWKKGLEELGKDSINLEMVVDADDAPQKVATVLQEQWQSALPGLTISLKVEPKKQRVKDLQDGNYQLGLTRWGPDYADPMTYLGMWVTDNSNNYGFWSNADYDAIIKECTTGDLATDAKGRWAKLYDAEKIVMDNSVIFPLYTQCNAEMVSTKVSGVEFHPVALNRVYKNAVKSE